MKIQVKDIIEYFQSMDPEKEVFLDKDGWMENETGKENPTPREVIRARGLVWETKTHVIINN